MDTHLNRFNEAVLMCTHSQCFEQNKNNLIIFHLKITIFTAVKYCCILYGRVFVMCINLGFEKSKLHGRVSII